MLDTIPGLQSENGFICSVIELNPIACIMLSGAMYCLIMYDV